MIRLRDIKRAVAAHYGFGARDLDGPWQSARLVRARHVALFLARRLTSQSLPQIGRAFGGRDHSTVIRAIARIEADLAEDAALRNEIAALRTRLQMDAPEDARDRRTER